MACIIIGVWGMPGCGPAPRKADLVVGVERGPSSLDPRVGSDQGSQRLYDLVHRSLFKPGPSLEAVPDLARSVEILTEKRYRITLRRGVRYPDGREVTAADAAYTLHSIIRGDVVSYRRGDLERIERIETPDKWTLDLHLEESYAPLLDTLTVGILPEGTPADGSTFPGCGPYQITRVIQDQWVLLRANDSSPIPPKTSTLAFKIIPDAVVRSLELRRGSVDMVVNDLPPDAVAYFRRPGYRVQRTNGANYRYIGVRMNHPILKCVEVRRAIAHALDRELITRTVIRGFGRPATSLLCPENRYHRPGLADYPFDPKRAERLLDEAGFPRRPEGRFSLTYKTSSDKVSRQVAVAVQENLGRVGIRLTIESLEWGTFYGDVKRGDFDLFGLTWLGIRDPDAYRLRFSSSFFAPHGLNRGRYRNSEIDALVRAGVATALFEERRPIYDRVQEILAEELPYIPLWYPDNVIVAREGFDGGPVPPDGNFGFLTTWGPEKTP